MLVSIGDPFVAVVQIELVIFFINRFADFIAVAMI